MPRGPLKRPKVTVDTKLVDAAMAKLLPEIHEQFAKGLTGLAKVLVKVIKDGTPVLTGDLQSTVRAKKVSVKKASVMLTIQVGGIKGKATGKNVGYAAQIHQLGSPRGRGRFFVITPVLDAGDRVLPRLAETAVTRAVGRVGK